MMTSTTGLSVQQRDIPGQLWGLHRDRQRAFKGRVPGFLQFWGVDWSVTGTRSEQASVSRTLARLEPRGLILRQNYVSGRPDTENGAIRTSAVDPHNRTTSVVLLRAGITLAKRLTTSRRMPTHKASRC